MNKYRSEIERTKEELRLRLEQDAEVYKRSIIREIDYLYRTYSSEVPSVSLESFSGFALNKLNIPLSLQNTISRELKEAQRQIAEVWNDFYFDTASFRPGDYEKMIALYKVDFPDIKKELRDAFKSEIGKSVRADYGYNTLRQKLLKRDTGEATAKTLANTGCAQFDNAYMFENALQAGIEEFFYDGVLHPNSRRFCREQLMLAKEGHVYTIAGINELDNHQGLPVLTSCGGYNCTHYWTPYIKELFNKQRGK